MVDQLLARTTSAGTTNWYLDDNLGSVRDVVSITGVNQDHIVYDSFGNILTETNATNGDRFKFAGMQFDSTTGQYHDHARDYTSAAGRFMTQDPLGFRAGDANLARYVNNGPTDKTDPSGLVDDSGTPMKQLPAPTGPQLLSHPSLQNEFIDTWDDSYPGSSSERHEEGGWIYQNIRTGVIDSRRAKPGKTATLNIGNPPQRSGWRIVGTFHTHPNPKSGGWRPGPAQKT